MSNEQLEELAMVKKTGFKETDIIYVVDIEN